ETAAEAGRAVRRRVPRRHVRRLGAAAEEEPRREGAEEAHHARRRQRHRPEETPEVKNQRAAGTIRPPALFPARPPTSNSECAFCVDACARREVGSAVGYLSCSPREYPKPSGTATLSACLSCLVYSGITTPTAREAPMKVGRNDPCPCGSGKKYKKCCMNKDQ